MSTVKKKLTAVRTSYNMQFFGINTSQVSDTMQGIHLDWNGEVVVVTSDHYKGQEKWIFPAGICEVTWKDVKEEDAEDGS